LGVAVVIDSNLADDKARISRADFPPLYFHYFGHIHSIDIPVFAKSTSPLKQALS
jgi:hypothetical protein